MAVAGQYVGNGRYRLDRPLGSGAFGSVWESWDEHEHAVVAVKLLSPGVQPGAVLTEARLQRRLSEHPRIVSMRNVVTAASPSPLVVLDYVADGSLDAVLHHRRPTIIETQRWLRDTLEALRHAHALDVLHRDVKPSNLLLGSDGHAQLTDFGVAEDSVRRAAVTPGMYFATLPPEFPASPSTEQTDLWLVGVLAWQLLTGARPSLQDAHAGTLAGPHRFALEVPLALSRIVMSALAPNPGDRPESAARMLESIAAVPIHRGWRDLASTDPSVVRAWQSGEPGAQVTVQIQTRPRGDFEVTAHAAPGRRLRRARREISPTLAGAHGVARRWLLEVVAGGNL